MALLLRRKFTLTTPSGPATNQAPNTVSVVPHNTRVDVTWTYPANTNPRSSQTVHLVDVNGGNVTSVDGGTGTSTTVTGLAGNTVYRVEVLATYGSTVLRSTLVTFNTTSFDAVAPGIPSHVIATAGQGSVTVTWTAPGDTGGSPITGYTVTANDYDLGPIGTVTSTTTSAVYTGLTVGTYYYFTVAATNAIGTGTASQGSNPVTPTGASGAVLPFADSFDTVHETLVDAGYTVLTQAGAATWMSSGGTARNIAGVARSVCLKDMGTTEQSVTVTVDTTGMQDAVPVGVALRVGPNGFADSFIVVDLYHYQALAAYEVSLWTNGGFQLVTSDAFTDASATLTLQVTASETKLTGTLSGNSDSRSFNVTVPVYPVDHSRAGMFSNGTNGSTATVPKFGSLALAAAPPVA